MPSCESSESLSITQQWRNVARRISLFTAVLIFGLSLCAAVTVAAEPPGPNVLWYDHPVPRDKRGSVPWDQGMPIGNGRLGGVLFGQIEHERIQLNEDTLWVGGPRDTNNPEFLKNLPKVRQLLFDGKPGEALSLANQTMLGRPASLRPYQTLGDLRIDFAGGAVSTNYRRELNLADAVASVDYLSGDAQLRREAFCSAPDQVMVVRLTNSKPAGISCALSLSRPAKVETSADVAGRVEMHGRLDNQPGDGRGLEYHVAVRVVLDGGKFRVEGNKLLIDGANSAMLLLAGETSYRQPNPAERARQRVDEAAARSYDQLRRRHVADYSKYFDRVALKLDSPDEAELARLPTDERLSRVKRGGVDLGLVAQYFQFGRYLLISCSRPGTQPANLQGIWADGLNPPWSSDYHLNINIQMNYWPAETTNLAEMHLPLVDFVESLREPGRKTARVQYGARGFVVHHITDPWGFTTVGDGAQYGLWPTGAAWLCQHLWEHYDFSRDKAYLARVYPTMKEAAEFFLDAMVVDGKGRLVVGPSISPENRYRLANGQIGVICMGATMDSQIVRGLFSQCIAASEVLGVDEPLRKLLIKARDQIAPTEIGSNGTIKEWAEDYGEVEPGHRHISHLFGLYPSDQITRDGTPELFAAARRTIERRLAHGGGHTGWSRAWIINFWARLGDGDQAWQNILALLRKSTLPNLWDLHPPFQIDGNFGATAAIAEMLLQSQQGQIDLLPALPKAWPAGQVRGLRARGGVEVDLAWSEGRLATARLRPQFAGALTLIVPDNVLIASLEKGKFSPLKTATAGTKRYDVTVNAGQEVSIKFEASTK